jgi:nucleoporin p58/p45
MTNIGRAIWQTSADVKAASDEQAALAQGLYSLRASLEQLATRVNEQATDLQKLLETWEAAKPLERRSANIRPIAHRDFPQDFFFRVAKNLEERVNRYRRNIMLLHRAIVGLASDAEALTPPVVAQTIQNNQAAIISLAAQLDHLQLRMNSLRTEFTHDYREKTNSMRDPFEVAREEKGVSLLRA